jgi:hypothetical protein
LWDRAAVAAAVAVVVVAAAAALVAPLSAAAIGSLKLAAAAILVLVALGVVLYAAPAWARNFVVGLVRPLARLVAWLFSSLVTSYPTSILSLLCLALAAVAHRSLREASALRAELKQRSASIGELVVVGEPSLESVFVPYVFKHLPPLLFTSIV